MTTAMRSGSSETPRSTFKQVLVDRVDHAVLQVTLDCPKSPSRPGTTGWAGAPSTFSRRNWNISYLPAFLPFCPDPILRMSHLMEKL
jgi:hypothetical protein